MRINVRFSKLIRPLHAVALLAGLLCCLGGPASLAFAEASSPRQVRFIPHWAPQAQFAGYYVAQEKGYYARRGLDVEILPGGPDNPAGMSLTEGRAEFAVSAQTEAGFAADSLQRIFRPFHLGHREGVYFLLSCPGTGSV